MIYETEYKRSRCMAMNQYYKYKMMDEVFGTISEELIVKRNAGEVIDAYAEYMGKEKKQYKKISIPNLKIIIV